MDEAGTGHRFDRGADWLAVPGEVAGQGGQGIGIGPDRGHLDGLASLIEQMHIEPLAR